MRKAILYIAMSLDGYIADARGGVDWLTGDGSEPEHEGSYPAFYHSIDTVIMGHTTYRQITCELSPGHWVYGDKKCYVITHQSLPAAEEAVFAASDPAQRRSGQRYLDLRRGVGGRAADEKQTHR